MSLPAGTRFGPYEVVTLIGAGGMGAVYRARDTRLGRDVAVKVLPAEFSADADRLRRFEQEARSASALNHPNILTIFDVGEQGSIPYVVSELLEGETLRQKMTAGLLPQRKAIDYALQIAKGLAAAHEMGIVHRDLKPENLFVTKDGRLKILDFGLAKLTSPRAALSAETNIPTTPVHTESGLIVGTAGYMSPEQVRGQAADHRSDLFSFGSVLYEMLTGQRAFARETGVETMSAVLKEEPPLLNSGSALLPPGIDRIVRRCLEKSREERFQSSSDLAFALESLSGFSMASGSARLIAAAPRARRLQWLAVAAAFVAAAALAYLLGTRSRPSAPPEYRQLTFRRGQILTARFSRDGRDDRLRRRVERRTVSGLHRAARESRVEPPVASAGGPAGGLALGRAGPLARQEICLRLDERRDARPRAAFGRGAARGARGRPGGRLVPRWRLSRLHPARGRPPPPRVPRRQGSS